MKQVDLDQHLAARGAQAQRILADLGKFKVCEQCLSIAFKQAAICPLCHAYSWFDAPSAVEVIAKYSAKQPFPLSSAVAPRLPPAPQGDK